jgi:hypothetical protein
MRNNVKNKKYTAVSLGLAMLIGLVISGCASNSVHELVKVDDSLPWKSVNKEYQLNDEQKNQLNIDVNLDEAKN